MRRVCLDRGVGGNDRRASCGHGQVSGASVPALSPRACPRPGEKSGRRRRSLPGDWAAPPMLLVGPRRPSAQRGCRGGVAMVERVSM